MTAECFSAEYPRFEHRKGSRYSYLKSGPETHLTQVDLTPEVPYNEPTKSESFRIVAKAPESLLEPLMHGKAVTLLMTVPAKPGPRKQLVKEKQIPVVIIPGSLFGNNPELFLVSVVGKGSAVIAPRLDGRVANLVLSGMPARLAHALMDEFHRLLWRY